jgi:processive 1,2-diacylglycerol beta-glucosyltransferase
MLGRVLVLSASAGAGHLLAAEALEKAIRLRDLASEVQHVDVLKTLSNHQSSKFRHA